MCFRLPILRFGSTGVDGSTARELVLQAKRRREPPGASSQLNPQDTKFMGTGTKTYMDMETEAAESTIDQKPLSSRAMRSPETNGPRLCQVEENK